MISFDEVSDETWKVMSLILGKPSLLNDCLACLLASDEEPASALGLERLVHEELSRRHDRLLTTETPVGPRLVARVQWPFVEQALLRVCQAFLVPDSFDWTDAAEAAFADKAT
jgi:hypothetical protein